MRARIYTLVSVPVFIILYSFTFVIVLISLFFAILKRKKSVQHVIHFWAKSVFYLMGKKLTIKGMQNIQKGGNYILIANHASLFDIMAIMAFYPNVSWFGHERLLRIPVFKQILLMTNYVPMKSATFSNTKRMLDSLIHKSQTNTIAIFHEGTRTLDGQINNFYKGFIRLMKASDVNILPVTLNGFYSLKPKNRFHINFNSKINVIIHKPIERSLLINKSDSEIIESVKEVIQSAIIK
ncbi:MAG: 1-acyl-sn-glycerol-3-phosphate acyltransferase [Bacteroidetes bacterium]|nr:1-acyl-sn-glycerol-3-phosphate acyltransferase [Bacteroidota bacterium]